MYELEKKVYYRDTDISQQMSLGAVLDNFQDIINMHSEAINKGIDYILRVKRAWFVVSWNIEIKKLPKLYDTIVLKTWPHDIKSSVSGRNVCIFDKEGNPLVCADSIWSVVDMETGRLTRIIPEDIEDYGNGEAYPMEDSGRKIALPEGFEEQEIVRVRKTDIDYNGHMSNAYYLRYACEYIPDGVVCKRIRIEYKLQTKYGESLRMLTARDGDRIVVKMLGADDDKIRAVVEITV